MGIFRMGRTQLDTTQKLLYTNNTGENVLFQGIRATSLREYRPFESNALLGTLLADSDDMLTLGADSIGGCAQRPLRITTTYNSTEYVYLTSRVFYSNALYSYRTLLKFDHTGNCTKLVGAANGYGVLGGVALDASTNKVYYVYTGNGSTFTVKCIDVATGNTTDAVASLTTTPSADSPLFYCNGYLYYFASTGKVYRVNLSSGTCSVYIDSAITGTNGTFSNAILVGTTVYAFGWGSVLTVVSFALDSGSPSYTATTHGNPAGWATDNYCMVGDPVYVPTKNCIYVPTYSISASTYKTCGMVKFELTARAATFLDHPMGGASYRNHFSLGWIKGNYLYAAFPNNSHYSVSQSILLKKFDLDAETWASVSADLCSGQQMGVVLAPLTNKLLSLGIYSGSYGYMVYNAGLTKTIGHINVEDPNDSKMNLFLVPAADSTVISAHKILNKESVLVKQSKAFRLDTPMEPGDKIYGQLENASGSDNYVNVVMTGVV